jgi:hypothetical protein
MRSGATGEPRWVASCAAQWVVIERRLIRLNQRLRAHQAGARIGLE